MNRRALIRVSPLPAVAQLLGAALVGFATEPIALRAAPRARGEQALGREVHVQSGCLACHGP